MKLVEILPELEEGGVERHVSALAAALSEKGHEILVVSGGGKLERTLPAAVPHRLLPVHLKNPASILYCASRIAAMARREGFQLFHAHSRVPAWIGYLASLLARVPLVVSAHFLSGNRSRWIYRPYRRAARVICVSRSVEEEMAGCFSGNTVVVRNGMPSPSCRWQGPKEKGARRLLFIGRLSRVKGLQYVLQALATIRSAQWQLDILGDGAMRPILEETVRTGGIDDRVFFHGFRDDTDQWLQQCSCLLFPSFHEGMPLTLARAIQIGTPIIASDIPAVRELCSRPEVLLPPGDLERWRGALGLFLTTGRVPGGFAPESVPTLQEMAKATESIYRQVLVEHQRGQAV